GAVAHPGRAAPGAAEPGRCRHARSHAVEGTLRPRARQFPGAARRPAHAVCGPAGPDRGAAGRAGQPRHAVPRAGRRLAGAGRVSVTRTPTGAGIERAQAQRARIMAAARKCFVEYGFHAASMGNIAQQADMSAGLIYRYYASKSAIIIA